MSPRLGRILTGVSALFAFAAPSLAAQEAVPAIPAGIELEVYATALAFYSPLRGQVRWLEGFEPGLRRALIARLGDRFLPWSEGARGSGGRLRVSPIEAAGPDRYRLTVEYRHRTPYFEGPASAQAFLVGCDGLRCAIVSRGGVGGEDSE